MKHNSIVSRDEWTEARRAFLDKEKEFTRARDALSAALRRSDSMLMTLEPPRLWGRLLWNIIGGERYWLRRRGFTLQIHVARRAER